MGSKLLLQLQLHPPRSTPKIEMPVAASVRQGYRWSVGRPKSHWADRNIPAPLTTTTNEDDWGDWGNSRRSRRLSYHCANPWSSPPPACSRCDEAGVTGPANGSPQHQSCLCSFSLDPLITGVIWGTA
ncbi:hypothetical protein B0H67DRAFT_272776 [Lasiosphaeris hirsuta]|uniref:Uncharacterized protein n=1 Tax=Lasiosphaeris hirsuta TaxID=260670 RepID=A0AA40A8F9_9PEZI|nr:hypothetical protein B0H67DRAFT_272776 [Lasiosphaeris hirsuta]